MAFSVARGRCAPRAARSAGAVVTPQRRVVTCAASPGQAQKIQVEKPSEAQLQELGVKSWPTWGCDASKFPWSYGAKEVAYLLEGEVFVIPDGGGEAVEIGAGDLCTFPEGMSCTWDVRKPINKHYKFY